MAKSSKIYEQEQALSVYFKDMLGEQLTPSKTEVAPKPAEPSLLSPAITQIEETETNTASQTEVEPVETQNLEGDIRLLLFKAAGMELALPVDDLNNIVRWPEKSLTKIPGRAAWALGIYSHAGIHTEVIDIQHILAPGSEQSSSTAEYIILVEDHKWGIACEQIRQIINMPRNEINWRSGTDKRPWFKGIVNDKMSSILDVSILIDAIRKK